MKRFDRKFGAGFLRGLPSAPAVYLFKDEADQVLYVGKAKDVRQRLSSYRNASRRKVHRKMRAIVRDSFSLEVRVQATEEDALALENELIRTLTPSFNVEGKYFFLYPAIGIQKESRRTLICFTTDTPAWKDFDFQWFGVFRSRPRAKEAFDALVELVGMVAHLERTSSLGSVPDIRGSRIVGARQLDPELHRSIAELLAGSSPIALRQLSLALLEKPRARREAAHVEDQIRCVADFYHRDLQPLHSALGKAGRPGEFVSQEERDTLFIRHG